MQEFFCDLLQKDGHTTRVHIYQCDEQPKGSLLMLHSMAEHEGRYREFAEYMVSQGYDFYCYNLRGHGSDAEVQGHIADRGGQNIIVEDAINVAKYVQDTSRGEKMILMGQGFGSILARNVIQHKDDFDAVILSGTAAFDRHTAYTNLAVTKTIAAEKGPRAYSDYVTKRFFRGKDFQAVCTESPFDWISADKENLARYVKDPYAGFPCTVQFYHDLTSLILFGGQKEKIARTRRSLPIFFLSGAMDPVGGLGRQVTALYHTFLSLGFQKVSCKLYENDRHEILNEQDRETVMHDISDWLDKIL